MESYQIPVHRIIPFSNVEGDGNRTSIFVQGCDMNCIYCHNPETIAFPSSTTKYMDIHEILEIVKKSLPFIRGITISGGEPTLYRKQLTKLIHEIHKLGITAYIDSNGYFDLDDCKELIDTADGFLLDIKGLKHPKLGESSMSHVEKNLSYLLEVNKVKEIRFVYIKNLVESKNVVEMIGKYLKDHPDVILKIIGVHDHGLSEEQKKEVTKNIPSPKEIRQLANYALSLGIEKIKVQM